MKIWNDNEVKDLFDNAQECKKNGNSLKNAFVAHAKKYNRKPNSVRNYYYHEVDNLENDEKRCKRLGVDLKLHQKSHFKNFEESDENVLIEKIEALVKQGNSVRSACLKLSGGDLALMTRFQNKYQSVKKRKNEKMDNVIVFRQKQKTLTESEINSLFFGLVKLIKKTAVEDFVEKNKIENNSSNLLLKKAIFDLSKKDKQLSQLREEFDALKNENKKLLQKIDDLSMDKKQMLKTHLAKKKLEQTL